ncbi:MAG TPA: methyltransferase domain-containing protein [Gallionella sp.]|nr:methyltransferase domain-containing protein [Gallionella sp.]
MKHDFSQRSTQAELMDTEPLGFAAFHAYLCDLTLINICTLAYRPTLRWLRLVVGKSQQPVSVIDIGSGGGDMLRRIWKWAGRHKINVDLVGADLNPWSKQSAEKTTAHGAPIHFETSDIFDFDPERRADFIISSLFTHHLTDEEVIRFIQWMDAHAVHGWFINDLHRHPVPHFLIKWFTRFFGFNRLVQYDAPLSVARAFVRADWHRLLIAADIPMERVRITWYFPFRYGVACRCTEMFSNNRKQE